MENIIGNRRIIGIIDYGAGNILSVANAIEHLGYDYVLINNSSEINKCDRLILPGVGSFKKAMENIYKREFHKAINIYLSNPANKLLGICLGLQLFYEFSEEDEGCEGLGLIKGSVKRIQSSKIIKVPNIGWHELKLIFPGKLFQGENLDNKYYFIHSYGCITMEDNIVSSIINYNGEISTSIEKDNIYGVQFHPEKSQIHGLKILDNFFQ